METEIQVPKRLCRGCGDPFASPQPRAVYCSDKCRSDAYTRKTGRTGTKGIPSGTVGTIAELEVCNDLMRKGYSVFRAQSPACFCDLVAIKEKTIRIEVRTGYIGETFGTLLFPKAARGPIDVFAVYVAAKDQIFYLDTKFKELKL